MCWRCEHPGKTLDDYVVEVVVPTVSRYGWAVQGTPTVTYTVGLTAQGRPELAVTGKPPDAAYDLLDAVLAGEEVPRAGERCDLLSGPAVQVVAVAHPRRLAVAQQLYGPRVRALQLVWADSRGRWPWDLTRSAQELLGAVGLPLAG